MFRILIVQCACAALLPAAQDAVVIDGRLSDSIWNSAAAMQLDATEAGVPADRGGEIRLAVAGRYLYIGARLPESGRVTARSIGRNPHWEEEDLLRIVVGAYPDFTVQVGPLGAYSIETKGQPIPTEKFLGAAHIGDGEWTAEVAIPLNDLKALRLDEVRITAERVRAMRPLAAEQHWRWPASAPAGKLPAAGGDLPAPVFRPELLGNPNPPLEIGRTAALPPLDPDSRQAAWKGVPAWKLRRNEALARFPRHGTTVQTVHGDGTLSVLAKCADPAGDAETFDVYLATSGSGYVRFSVNPAGMLRQFAGMNGGERVSRPRTDWTSSARAAAARSSDAWTVRMDIPLAEVAEVLGELQTPREWRALFLRSRPAAGGDPQEASVLPVTRSETALCPARYQRLVLAENAPPANNAEGESQLPGAVLSAEQRKELNPPQMLGRALRERALRILKEERAAWDLVNTQADWETFRDRRVKALAASLGPFPSRTPLHPRITREFPGEGYRRQDLLYESRPGLWVAANLYLPARSAGPIPGIVIVHSHHRPRTQAELQDMGILWARAGAAVLIMDQIGAGERLQNYPWNREAYHSRYILGMQLHLVGESLIKWMVWDIMRGVDLLLDRRDIDKDRIMLIGAVAAGGDPAAVTAALDSRIGTVVPFNFGEASPENTRSIPEKNRWPLELADPGWGGWETTRSLRRSIADQFLPWLICASVAPRRFLYSFEMGWNVEEMPAWARYQKVYGLYGARQNLAEAHGFGPFPGPGECTNIGPAQRKTMYPTLERWLHLPPPAHEPEDRRPEVELNAITPAVAATLPAKTVHEMAAALAREQLDRARAQLAQMQPAAQRDWLRSRWAGKLGDVEPNRQAAAAVQWTKPMAEGEVEGVTLAIEPGILVPMLVLKPKGFTHGPAVIVVAEHGKDAILSARRNEIATLLRRGTLVCLPDVRGTGETAPDERRGPASAEVSLSTSALMLGETLLGERLKDLRTVIAYVAARPDVDGRIALWGDGLTPANPAHMVLDELPNWQIGPQIQQQAEPLGGLLALLAALYEDRVAAVAVEGGLESYASVLEDSFAYVPADVILPGALTAGDIPDVARALAPRPVLLENQRDGRNRNVGRAVEPPHPAQWLSEHISR